MNAFEQALQDIHDIRASAKQSVLLQTMQAGLLAQISATMGSMHAEMALARKHQADALAIQQELLTRERMQAYLEEFIYQAQKLIAECTKVDTALEPSTRFFLLYGILTHIAREGIGTPIVRGRENKAAFDHVVNEAKALCNQLNRDPEVQKAIAWAKRLEDQRRREQEEEQREQEEREREKKRRQRARRLEEEQEEEEWRREQAARDQRTQWIVVGAVGGLLALILAGCLGCCLLGRLGNPQPRAGNQPIFPGK